jgi:hypothetical protein
MRKTAIQKKKAPSNPPAPFSSNTAKVCTGPMLAEALSGVRLSAAEAAAWQRDLKAARKNLKAPIDKWL